MADLSELLPPALDNETEQLLDELHSLPPKQRAAIVLRYYEGLSDVEIADVLGAGVMTVRSNISRGLAKLRIQLSESLTTEVVR